MVQIEKWSDQGHDVSHEVSECTTRASRTK